MALRGGACAGAAAAVLALSAPAVAGTLPGTWRMLPASPLPPTKTGQLTSVWTGGEMIVFGRAGRGPGGSGPCFNTAAAYRPSTGRWRRLHPPPALGGCFEGSGHSVWTGSEMLTTAPLGYTPNTGRWRPLALSPGKSLYGVSAVSAVVAWSGREMIGWGGGCCGDASNAGAAYDPASNGARALPASPLAPRQPAAGTWTGEELIVAGGADADGHAFRGAAAYVPATDTWRRIAPLPTPYRGRITAWTGREMLLVGGSPRAGVGFAYTPGTNRWRALPRMPQGGWELGVWTGHRLLVFGGRAGVAYTPATNRWSRLPVSPLPAQRGGVGSPTGVWTGREMIVWTPAGAAAFRPTRP